MDAKFMAQMDEDHERATIDHGNCMEHGLLTADGPSKNAVAATNTMNTEQSHGKFQSLSSKDYVITNCVKQIDGSRHHSNVVLGGEQLVPRVRYSEPKPLAGRERRQHSIREAGPSATVTDSERNAPLSGLSQSVPVNDLDFMAQSRLLQSQNSQGPLMAANVVTSAQASVHDPLLIQEERHVDQATDHDESLPS